MKFSILVILFISFVFSGCSQTGDFKEAERQYMRIMFYNVENLFDIIDDSTHTDEDYTPEGRNHWTENRYNKKLNNISKVITAVGQWEAPEIVGLSEIENLQVLRDLVKNTALKKIDYQIIHQESPDKRGIDVALLYRAKFFTPLSYVAIPVTFSGNSDKATRDILYIKGIDNQKDTLHIFVNHWPSRWGGQAQTDEKRVRAASILRQVVDSLFKVCVNPNVIIMGDLNDYPDNNSVVKSLRAKTDLENEFQDEELYNLAFYLQNTKGKGSHKYKGEWGVLDQIIVSGNLFDKNQKLYLTKDDVNVFDADFLLEKDEQYTGFKPFRTYSGMKFHGGFSDHLPVYIDLRKK